MGLNSIFFSGGGFFGSQSSQSHQWICLPPAVKANVGWWPREDQLCKGLYEKNFQLSHYISLCPYKKALAANALWAPWPKEVLYAFPSRTILDGRSFNRNSSGEPKATAPGGSPSHSGLVVHDSSSSHLMGAVVSTGCTFSPPAPLAAPAPLARAALISGKVHKMEGMCVKS